MKYFLIVLTLFTSLIVFSTASAQTSFACQAITDQASFDRCCTGASPEGNINQCFTYSAAQQAAAQRAACQVVDSEERYQACCPQGNSSQQCAQYYAAKNVSGRTGGGLTTGPINTGTTTTTTTTVTGGNINTSNCAAIKFTSIIEMLIWIRCIIGSVIIPLIFALAFVAFLWGVFKFISASAEKDREESKKFIFWGILGLFVMVSVWGIIKILANTLGTNSAVVPALQTQSNTSK